MAEALLNLFNCAIVIDNVLRFTRTLKALDTTVNREKLQITDMSATRVPDRYSLMNHASSHEVTARKITP